MRTPNPANALTTIEIQEVSGALDNGVLMGGLCKIWRAEAEYWRAMGKAEALKPNPNSNLMIQYAARESMAEQAERLIAKGVGR